MQIREMRTFMIHEHRLISRHRGYILKVSFYWNRSNIILPSEFFGGGIFKICAIVGAISIMFIGLSLTYPFFIFGPCALSIDLSVPFLPRSTDGSCWQI